MKNPVLPSPSVWLCATALAAGQMERAIVPHIAQAKASWLTTRPDGTEAGNFFGNFLDTNEPR